MDKMTKILTQLDEGQNLVRIVGINEGGYTIIATGAINFYSAGDETITIEHMNMPNKTFKVKAIKTIEVMTEVWNKGQDNGTTKSN